MARRPTLLYEPEPSLAGYFRELKLRAGLVAATLHRRGLRGVAFIGVTGSCGKTTTKELIAATLGGQFRGRRSPRGGNSLDILAKTVLRTTSADDYCVLEIAAGHQPGHVGLAARMVRPDVAVVTRIGHDHHRTYKNLEATAAEKQALVEGVVEGGTVVLNADDPYVLAMARGFRGRVVTVGCSPTATFRAQNVRSSWPEPLAFDLQYGGRTVPVTTQLHGRHWVTSALAALAVAVTMGVPVEAAAAYLAAALPVPGRMQPAFRDGITFIRDDVKAPMWTLDAAFEFLAQARAPRKVLVIGTISDSPLPSSRKYLLTARRALAVADEVVFAGSNARHAQKAVADGDSPSVRAFPTVPEAADYLRSALREGDLVMIKGSEEADGLERILNACAPRGGGLASA